MRRKKEPPPTAADARNKNPRHECKKATPHDSDAAKPRGVNPPQAESRPHWGRTPKPSPRNAPKNNRRAPRPKGGEPPPMAADARNQNPRYRPKTARQNENCILS